jgi:50S ribosomal subunit-associated GTPase HflX
MRGPGETEIETDRRIVRDRISLLKDIKAIDKQTTQRGNRGAMVRVALVGYTNVGKSTLMNAIGKSDVLSKTNFCDFDTTVRKAIKPAFLPLTPSAARNAQRQFDKLSSLQGMNPSINTYLRG